MFVLFCSISFTVQTLSKMRTRFLRSCGTLCVHCVLWLLPHPMTMLLFVLQGLACRAVVLLLGLAALSPVLHLEVGHRHLKNGSCPKRRGGGGVLGVHLSASPRKPWQRRGVKGNSGACLRRAVSPPLSRPRRSADSIQVEALLSCQGCFTKAGRAADDNSLGPVSRAVIGWLRLANQSSALSLHADYTWTVHSTNAPDYVSSDEQHRPISQKKIKKINWDFLEFKVCFFFFEVEVFKNIFILF